MVHPRGAACCGDQGAAVEEVGGCEQEVVSALTHVLPGQHLGPRSSPGGRMPGRGALWSEDADLLPLLCPQE